MLETVPHALEFDPDESRLEFEMLPEADNLASLGGTTPRLCGEAEPRTNEFDTFMNGDDKPSLDPRDPRFEGEEHEREEDAGGTPQRDPESLPEPKEED